MSYSHLPSAPGVYIYKNSKGAIIYVGKAKDLKKRVSSYFSKSNPHDFKTMKLVSEIASLQYIQVASEIEAFLLEPVLIRKYRPFYNIQFQDDKYFPYIKIGPSTKARIPYVAPTRKKDEKDSLYFGPYPSAGNVKTVLKILRKIFPFQTTKNHGKRQCLYYHLKMCPCIPAHPENLPQYIKNIRYISQFLKGKKEQVIKLLLTEQKIYVEQEEFEKAAEIQKKIDKINYITSDSYHPFEYEEKPDHYFDRIQTEMLSLKNILNANGFSIEKLNLIECYDISNFQGKQATGSLVTFENGDANPSKYKRFKIRTKSTPDDFTMMKEVLGRRLKHPEWDMPDLFVIDGGKGQVSSAVKVLVELGVTAPIIGLAKREEIIVIPVVTVDGLEFTEVKIPNSTPGINLLRRIRDEAHRFVITYHRLLRKKAFLS